MNSELGAFMLRQLLNSTAIIGPILLLIGFSFYIFRQSRRSIYMYLSAGIFFSVIGMIFLYQEFSQAARERNSESVPEHVEQLAVEPAQK